MHPDDKSWFSTIEAPLVAKSEQINWDKKADIVIVGCGGAGISAALHALEDKQSVVAIDRFDSGGATKASGGVVYAGGGTKQQKDAGVKDTAKQMFDYLKLETGTVVSDKTLRNFCQDSVKNMDWLEKHGVDFRATYWPEKTSYPAPQYFLYHPDNSMTGSYASKSVPAARGHRGYVPVEEGKKAMNLGGSIYTPLQEQALKKGLDLITYSEVKQIVTDNKDNVIGVKVLCFDDEKTLNLYKKYRQKAHKWMLAYPPILPGHSFVYKYVLHLMAKATKLEEQRNVKYISAKKAVILSAGGFVYNQQMIKEYAPKYIAGYPLGTDGDNGSGIRLGQSVGGKATHMNRVTAWRFINPPLSFGKGLILNAQGERFIDEMTYGATLGVDMVENHNGDAWLILDDRLIKQAKEDVKGDKALDFQRQLAMLNIWFGTKKASTIEALAEKISINPEILKKKITQYNAQTKDEFEKLDQDKEKLTNAPFYAINIGIRAKLFPCPTLTLGGLSVEETSGEVIHEATGKPIKGLYAAGRNAVGVCSHNYISGLSIADCIYSGRRAAKHIAEQKNT